MMKECPYDVALIGAGLAGLTMSIQLARAGYRVILFEKEQFPFHRVCGEYISLESASFLREMGIEAGVMSLPLIHRLEVSAPNGRLLKHRLDLGGMGISRFLLDTLLADIARREGVILMEKTKVQEVVYDLDGFQITTAAGVYRSRLAAGSFGKRSNLDLKFNRRFIRQKASGLNNYIGVKYHIRYDHPRDTIVLHNFSDGYCGMSAIEDGKSCLCYLTTAANLEKTGKSIQQMEKEILSANPFLRSIFRDAEFLMQEPVVISQVSFARKTLIENHMPMVGDAAGMITPLCGNGMSMAMHAGKILAGLMHEFLTGRISRVDLELSYQQAWQKQFANRLWTGRMIQRMFGRPLLTNGFIALMTPFPAAVDWLVKKTHGLEY